MIFVPLVVAAAAAAPQWHVQLTAAGSGAAETPLSGTTTTATPSGYGYGDAGLALSLFPGGVRDDDAPLSLQPFLQRKSSLRLGGGGGATSPVAVGLADLGPGFLTEVTTQRVHARAFAAGDVYVHRNVIVAAALFFDGWEDQLSPEVPSLPPHDFNVTLTPQLALGLRVFDVRVDVGWRVDLWRVRGAWGSPFWAQLFAHAFAVVRRRFGISADVSGYRDGAIASASFAVYFNRRVDAFISLSGGRSVDYDPSWQYDTVGGSVGVTAWQSRRFGASFAFAPSYMRTNTGYSRVQSLFELSIFSRPR